MSITLANEASVTVKSFTPGPSAATTNRRAEFFHSSRILAANFD